MHPILSCVRIDRLAAPLEILPVKRLSVRKFVANLSYYSIAPESLATLHCRECRSPLDIHQPNPNQPDQFLGTCAGCGAWYRIGSCAAEDLLTVVQLPEVGEVDPTLSDSENRPEASI